MEVDGMSIQGPSSSFQVILVSFHVPWRVNSPSWCERVDRIERVTGVTDVTAPIAPPGFRDSSGRSPGGPSANSPWSIQQGHHGWSNRLPTYYPTALHA